MNWFILICYLLFCYGLCNVIVFGEGPFYILDKWRNFANNIHPNFGKLFSCMMCLPANVGWVLSLIDWFIIKDFSFTPFNIIFNDTNLWYVAMIMDMGITSGFCWLLYVIDEYFEKKTSFYENNNLDDLD